MERAAPQVRVEHPRCPYCHTEATPDEPRTGCGACTAWSHDACIGEAGDRCVACGAALEPLTRRRGPQRRPAVKAPPLVERLQRADEHRRSSSASALVSVGVGFTLFLFLVAAVESLLGPRRSGYAEVLTDLAKVIAVVTAIGAAVKHRPRGR